MPRAILSFSIAAILTIITLYNKVEHSLDFPRVLPAGLYFLVAFLITFRPKVAWSQILIFAGLSMVLWLVLFGVSYNLLFLFIAPVAGGLGAWLITVMSRRLLQLSLKKITPIVITGVVATLLGIVFMIAVKNLPKETFTMGLKTGVIAGLWQLGVGIQMARLYR